MDFNRQYENIIGNFVVWITFYSDEWKRKDLCFLEQLHDWVELSSVASQKKWKLLDFYVITTVLMISVSVMCS